jgi:geranylgeranyl pyrophosphate synthase
MSTDAMRRYLEQALLRHAERDGWEALRMVSALAARTHPAGPSELALRACRAAGGTSEQGHPAAASLFCLHTAIHLVDDLIDGEERLLFDFSPDRKSVV